MIIRYLLFVLTIAFFHMPGVQAQNGVFVYGSNSDTLCFNTNDILEINHGISTANTVVIDCIDTTIVRNLEQVDSILFISIPDFMVLNEEIDDWDEIKIHKDGTIMMSKYIGADQPSEIALMLPNDSLGTIFSYIKFDENSNPAEIMMNNNKFLFDWLTEDMCNLTIVYSDSISFQYDSISIHDANRTNFRTLRNVSELGNTWQTKVGASLEMIGGALSVVAGSVMIAGSGIAEVFTVGGSTPISVPGIIGGGLAVGGGINSFRTGWNKMWTPGNTYNAGNDLGGTIYYQSADKLVGRATQYVPDRYFSYLIDTKYQSVTNPAGWIAFFLSAYGDVISGYGSSFSWFDLNAIVHSNKVITGLVKNISTSTATIRGYVSPDILGTTNHRFNTEYGIIIRSKSNSEDFQKYVVNNGTGGMFEHTFNNLKSGETYSYIVYYIDKTNMVSCLGEYKTFTTKSMPVYIDKIDIEKASYYPNHYTYNNKQYSFKYNCTTYVTLKDNTNVADWGYIYIDPDGQESEPISLKQYSGTVGDPRYAYCRNEPSGTVKLKGFVRYKDDEEIHYGEIQEFPIEYPTESSVTMTNCTFQGTENNASYQGKTYKYKSTYRYLFNASGAYWLKVGTEETGSGWSNWNNLPDYATSPVDGANALTVNYYYDDKTFSGDYDVYLKGTDATHSVSHTTSEYVTYTHSASQFTGCSYHAGTASSRAQGIMENDEEYNIVINKPIY